MMRLKKDCLDEYTLKKRREGIIEKEKEEKREVCGEHNGKGKRRKKRTNVDNIMEKEDEEQRI